MINKLSRLIIKGGVLSPGELKSICLAAESLGLKSISFGSRQDIIFPKEIESSKLDAIESIQIIKPEDEGKENIVSSYVSANIFSNTSLT